MITEWTRYVPESEREGFAPDRSLSLEIKLIPRRQFSKYLRAYEAMAKRGTAASEEDIEIVADLFVRHVRNVRNLVEDRVLDGGEFFDYAPPALLQEVTLAIVDSNKLGEGRIKDSRSRSDMPPSRPMTSESGGVANATLPSARMIWETSPVQTQNCAEATPPSAYLVTATATQTRALGSASTPTSEDVQRR